MNGDFCAVAILHHGYRRRRCTGVVAPGGGSVCREERRVLRIQHAGGVGERAPEPLPERGGLRPGDIGRCLDAAEPRDLVGRVVLEAFDPGVAVSERLLEGAEPCFRRVVPEEPRSRRKTKTDCLCPGNLGKPFRGAGWTPGNAPPARRPSNGW